MEITLSSDEIRHLSDVQRALLAPLDHGDTDAWYAALLGPMQRLFACDHVTLNLPDRLINTPLPEGQIGVFGAARMGARGQALAALIEPAFEAGLRAHPGPRAPSLHALLDAYGVALMLTDSHGRSLHRTPSLRELLGGPNGPAMLAGLAAVTHGAVATLSRDRLSVALLARTVEAPSGRFRIRASVLGDTATGEPRLLIAVEPLTPVFPTATHLQERYGMTPQEARVALRLAYGETSRDIAAALSVSVNTARTHSNRVLVKLGVRTRAEIPGRLLGFV